MYWLTFDRLAVLRWTCTCVVYIEKGKWSAGNTRFPRSGILLLLVNVKHELQAVGAVLDSFDAILTVNRELTDVGVVRA